MIKNLAQSWKSYKHCAQKDVYGTTLHVHVRDIYLVPIDIIIYQIYQLVGGFPAKFVLSRISRNIFFHMIGNESFHFIF